MAVDDGVIQAVDDAGVPYTVIVTPEDPSPEESNAGCVPAADVVQLGADVLPTLRNVIVDQ